MKCRTRRVVIFVALAILNLVAIVLTLTSISLREGFSAVVAVSKYRELLNAKAIVEDADAVATVTGTHDDWTAVPDYLAGPCPVFDTATFVTILPTFGGCVLALWALSEEFPPKSS
ncbi:MAG TPA: hypothetical protein VF624_08635 [Tepidisphaeraceae bacterium]|jgi:hypothetical protein